MVNTGEQVVQLAMEHHFAIILMDVELPVMDGIVATARIRDFESIHPARPRVPVVGCTAHELAKAEPVLLRVGMDAVLQKPWSVLALSACLSRLCPTSLTRDPKTPPCSDG